MNQSTFALPTKADLIGRPTVRSYFESPINWKAVEPTLDINFAFENENNTRRSASISLDT